MGRLENIIARNRRPNRPSEKLIASLVLGLVVLLILVLAVFTDLGIPPDDGTAVRVVPAAPAGSPGPAGPRDRKRVDGVLLLRGAPKPPAPAPASPSAPPASPSP